MPTRKELPSTLKRSPKKAQETWIKTHDSAVETYGEGGRAHMTAFASVKRGFEKVGDHWEPKEEKGPSDERAARGGKTSRRGGRSAGGVDANASKAHLVGLAKRLDIRGRTRMSKEELVEAIDRANQRETARSNRRRAASKRSG
ncbi:MAG: ChaB family protein [Actinomycetota bacterium]|nr:ChaB family protein [Actinomycetota bacterium]